MFKYANDLYVPKVTFRRNNPGNIVKGQRWKGRVKCKGRFECFKSPEYGVRAMYLVLRNYQRKHHLYTIDQIIHRWAPPSENKTKLFIAYVKYRTGANYSMVDLIQAMVKFESGKEISRDLVLRGIALA